MNISIITAVYNGAATIADCLESVCRQSHAAEHIIIDGGSTDGTLALLERYRPGVARLVSDPDNGIYDAMNKGIALATGDVIGILNADDFYADERVLARVAAVFADPEVEACYGDLVYLKENLRSVESGVATVESEQQVAESDSKVKPQNSKLTLHRYWQAGSYRPRSFYWGWMPPHPTFFVRRRIYEKYGTFNLDLGSAADYELMLRLLLKHDITTAYIPEVLVKMRAGGVSNASLANRLKANLMDRLAWEVNGLKPYPWTLICKPLRKLPQYLFRF